MRDRLPGQRDDPQRGGPQRDGLQPLHRHAVLLQQLPVQGAPVQLLQLQRAQHRADRRKARGRASRRRTSDRSARTAWPEIKKLGKNPNVTVRMRGVMEKCTFCVQRIEEAKIGQLQVARDSANTMVPRDSFTTACAQVCPAEAIVFGNVRRSREQGFQGQGAGPRLQDARISQRASARELPGAAAQSEPGDARREARGRDACWATRSTIRARTSRKRKMPDEKNHGVSHEAHEHNER